MKNSDLLKKLCSIPGASGDEAKVKDYLLEYIKTEQGNWHCRPEIFHGEDFQDCLVLVFGKPRTAVYAHMDSVGFTVGYDNNLIPIGGPACHPGTKLTGEDSGGIVTTTVKDENDEYYADFNRTIDRGTNLTYAPDFHLKEESVLSPYLDDRLGIWICLQLAETMQNGIIVFSCWEEHGGGTVPFLTKFIYEKYGVRQALISDITWVTEGVKFGQGCAISVRDRSVPRRKFLNRVIKVAEDSGVPYQLEVESAGGSDGKEIQSSPYPIDWCFVGAPEKKPHTHREEVHKKDIQSMLSLYRALMEQL